MLSWLCGPSSVGRFCIFVVFYVFPWLRYESKYCQIKAEYWDEISFFLMNNLNVAALVCSTVASLPGAIHTHTHTHTVSLSLSLDRQMVGKRHRVLYYSPAPSSFADFGMIDYDQNTGLKINFYTRYAYKRHQNAR